MSSVGEQNKVLAIPQHMIDGRRCDVKVPDGRVCYYTDQLKLIS